MSASLLTQSAVAVLLGTALGIGVCLLASLAPRVSAPPLVRRIAPYVRDIADPQGLGPVASPLPTLREAAHATIARVARLFGASDALTRRLSQAGWDMDAPTFRARQLLWALAGLACGALVVVASVVLGAFSPATVVVAPVFAAAGALVLDARLTHAARARTRRIEEELPTVLDFVALCMSAGEGILDSLRRVGAIGSGELTAEIRAAVIATGTGQPLAEALTDLGRRLDVVPLTRALDHLVAALERGAPLAAVLHAQAGDAREDAKRGLIEQAGRKEILMLLPLVFLILPLSVLYAVFPGIFLLRLGIG
ncbi:type II secretion system F family protein [Microbacterium sp. 10M-3C3]|uniref:type II secretion system F family protein n=1 Tax=Microbacterium sp. 10M-3C3 TaxID=2483401 RepID=UPI000F63E7DB|nr:type II secretion system F family protein [Microbacterium sp. 10M-3C3]